MRKYIILTILLSCLHFAARGQTEESIEIDLSGLPKPTTAQALRYWFDDDGSSLQTTQQLSGTHILDVSSLTDGLHIIHYQALDNNNNPSTPRSAIFLKLGMLAENTAAASLRYWFDDELTATGAAITGSAQLIDISRLIDGLHILHYQIVDNTGTLTTPASAMFLKLDMLNESTTAKSLRYWFDDEQMATESEAASGVRQLDTSPLIDGLHILHYQIVDSKGVVTTPVSAMFLKFDMLAESTTAKSLRYWFDDDKTTLVVTDVANGMQQVDASGLLSGLHTLHYQLVDDKDKVAVPMTRIFFKDFDRAVAAGENRITKYQYWLNTNSVDMQTVELANASNPYQLISLLPMQHEPIRSDCFHFELDEDGAPKMYAKNTFHIRFHDAAGYFSDNYSMYTDYSVSQAVADVTLLVPGQSHTASRPAENTIRWYKVEALRGDSLSFKADQACTLQLFAPSGQELCSVSAPEVLSYNGAYAPEDGTYYVALHDVTAQNASQVTITYQHIDKYAVLSHTPDEFGILPCAQVISISGNGYDKLTSAILRKSNEEISSESIVAQSKSEAMLVFAFSGNEAKGSYDLVLEFDDEGVADELIVPGAVTLSTPDFSDIEIEITDPRSVASPYPVSIKVTNSGNMTYSHIPFYMAYDQVEHITDMHLLNLELEADRELSDNGLVYIHDIDNFKQKGFAARMVGAVIPMLLPGESKTYVLGFRAGNHTDYNVYAWVGTPWNLYATETMTAVKALAQSSGSTIVLPGGGSDSPDAVVDGNVATSCMPGPCEYAGVVSRWKEDCNCATALYLDKVLADIHNVISKQPVQIASSGLFYDMDGKQPEYRLAHPNDLFGNWLGHCTPEPGTMGDVVSGLNTLQYTIGTNPCPEPVMHACNQWNPGDPNDIFGYVSESGSKYMREGITDVYYTIEFENDPKIANASAHTIVVKDTLDTSRFDMSTFAATGVKIGSVEMKLNGEKNFSKRTMDLRPAVNVIAQVSLSLDEKKGIAKWTIESLDPMSMEPTIDAMQGVLPVNYSGSGQGELTFDIKLKPGMVEGDEVSNRAGIVFDQEETIMTPTWTNTVDGTLPEGHVTDVSIVADATVGVKIEAFDEMSKPWKFDVYVQEGTDGAWQCKAANVPVDGTAKVAVDEGINYGFYAVVTDSAGNVEQKAAAREFTFEVFGSQIDTNTKLQLAEGWNWISHNQQAGLSAETVKPNAQRIMSQTKELYKDARFGWSGDLEELLPTQMYKVQMGGSGEIQLSGRLFNAAFRSITLYKGWNWIGYPVAKTMSPAEALAKIEAEEGDAIISQDGMATFSDGQWIGTLTEMQPGQGYMYRSESDKQLFLNATAQSSSRRASVQSSTFNVQYPEGWSFDKRKYPNVMGVVAQLIHNGSEVDAGEWLIGAFCGDECRGVAQPVGDVLLMNVYGKGGEQIEFRVVHRDSGELVGTSDGETFRVDILGTVRQPYILNMGELTGIVSVDNGRQTMGNSAYDLQGRRVDAGQATKGVYIVTDEKNTRTQKVVRK